MLEIENIIIIHDVVIYCELEISVNSPRPWVFSDLASSGSILALLSLCFYSWTPSVELLIDVVHCLHFIMAHSPFCASGENVMNGRPRSPLEIADNKAKLHFTAETAAARAVRARHQRHPIKFSPRQ